ncbi:CPBP family intramembrane glutamic endopeptidase [Niabella soli]|uniref:CAAX amino terminal protease n=1 Tax=Niabella soli DSM 19437 TaxID=929713 RepID=W0EWK2_9BACT|nr:CPBP family intramembrane glutamic endopeptidase [Niabella soli]AHF15160.1 CAAX amino terminal protease [Niabella soli DSM 19437]
MIRKVYRFALKINPLYLGVLLLIGILFINIIFAIIEAGAIQNGYVQPSGNKRNESLIFQGVLAVILAPIIETFLFQKLIIHSIKSYFKKNNINAIFISSVFFGLLHYDSFTRMFRAFFVGLVLGFFYTILSKKNNHPFTGTCLLHAGWNVLAVLLSIVLK